MSKQFASKHWTNGNFRLLALVSISGVFFFRRRCSALGHVLGVHEAALPARTDFEHQLEKNADSRHETGENHANYRLERTRYS